MDYLVMFIVRHAKFWRYTGHFVLWTSLSLILIGLRLSRRIDRVELKTGFPVVDLDKVLASLPLPIPTTTEGFMLFGLIAASGFVMKSAAKSLEKQIL